MQKRNRLTRETVERLKDNLIDYMGEWSSVNGNKKFRCFNSSAHRRNDNDPSAAIVPGSGNKYWTCFSCGVKGDIFKAVAYREGLKNFQQQAEFLGRKYAVQLKYEEEEARQHSADTRKSLVPKQKDYYYQDENNNIVYKVVRKEFFEDGVRKKDFFMFSKSGSGWIPGLKGVKRYLYKLPHVLKAIAEGEVIFLVEGEKCADQISDLGLVGTTTPGGAGSWRAHSKEFVPYLKGAAVVVIPDNDDSGRKYGEDILKSLKDVAASVRKLELPNLPPKGDIVDWVQAGGTKEKLLQLMASVERQGPVFERDFCYYKTAKDYDLKLSNFVINPKHRVVGENQSLIAAELVTEEGIRLERVLKSEDFNDVIAFRKAIPGFEFSYVGRAEELQHIKVLISKKNCPSKAGVEYTGFHKVKDNWYFVSEQGAIAENLESSEEAVLLEDCEELGTDILKVEVINKEELVTLAPVLFSFNTLNIVSTILGYVGSLFLKGKLRHINMKHNHLIIEGQSGSGKSSTMESVIAPLLSIRNNALNASECSAFALNRAASSSNFLPVIIDEYKPYAMAKHRVDLISNVMRNSYDGHVVMKGVATLKKNREFNAKASIILCGEVGVEETANVERSLKVVFASANHSEARRNSMKVLKQNSKLLNKLGRSLLNGGLRMNEKKLKELYAAISETLAGKDFANERVRNSITNCMLGIALLKGVFEELKVDFEEAAGVKMSEVLDSIKQAVYKDLLDNGNSSKGIIEASLDYESYGCEQAYR